MNLVTLFTSPVYEGDSLIGGSKHGCIVLLQQRFYATGVIIVMVGQQYIPKMQPLFFQCFQHGVLVTRINNGAGFSTGIE